MRVRPLQTSGHLQEPGFRGERGAHDGWGADDGLGSLEIGWALQTPLLLLTAAAER